MDKFDKAKLKVLIKMILIQQSPNCLSSSQLATIINNYNWGFRTYISAQRISKIMNYELNKRCNHFLEDIESYNRSGGKVYQYMGDD